jgi:hypothetical protein
VRREISVSAEVEAVLIEANAMRIAMLAKVSETTPGLGKIMENTFYHLSFPAHKGKVTLLM